MASSTVLKKLASCSLLTRSLRSISPTVTFPSRFISTKAVEDFFSGLYDPFRSTNQVSCLKDQITNNKGIHFSETREGLTFRVEMPGLGKDDVRVYVAEQDNLVIKGKKEGVCEEYKYSTRIPKECTGGIKAVMQNGVLEVVVPKVEGGDRAIVSNMKMTDEALYIRMAHMIGYKDGLKVKDMKVSVEQNTLIVDIEGTESEYIGRLDLPKTKKYNTDEIKATVKNGWLMVLVPLVNDEESIEV